METAEGDDWATANASGSEAIVGYVQLTSLTVSPECYCFSL